MYITTGQFCSYKGIDAVTGAEEVQLAGFIASAQRSIELATRKVFQATADSTRYFDARCDVDGRRLVLDRHLCAITAVTNGNGVVVTTDEYVTAPRNETPYYAIDLRSDSGLTWTYTAAWENAIAVVGRWAYMLNPDAVIIEAMLELTDWMYKRKDTGADIDRALLVADGSVVLPNQMPKSVMQLIAPYTRGL